VKLPIPVLSWGKVGGEKGKERKSTETISLIRLSDRKEYPGEKRGIQRLFPPRPRSARKGEKGGSDPTMHFFQLLNFLLGTRGDQKGRGNCINIFNKTSKEKQEGEGEQCGGASIPISKKREQGGGPSLVSIRIAVLTEKKEGEGGVTCLFSLVSGKEAWGEKRRDGVKLFVEVGDRKGGEEKG